MVAPQTNQNVVRVPDVGGYSLQRAQAMVKRAGLEIDRVLFRESYEERDTVLEQQPSRGKMAYEGSVVTLWVARRGYMEHLPAIYRRSDALGRNVVRDICFLFEHMFGPFEDTLEDVHRNFDPYECPPDFLPWLASWTALAYDTSWPEAKQRAIIRRAVELYRIRGTKHGLALSVKLFTDHEPIIDENVWPFKGFRVESEARIGIDSVVMPPVELAHCFTITMPIRFTDISPEMVIRIHQIIRLEKPAHTQYYLRFAADKGETELREFFSIGTRSGIGIGAEVVEEGSDQRTDGESQ